MSPPPTLKHYRRQTAIAEILKKLMGSNALLALPGEVVSGRGVSTSEGIKIPDVAWRSWERVHWDRVQAEATGAGRMEPTQELTGRGRVARERALRVGLTFEEAFAKLRANKGRAYEEQSVLTVAPEVCIEIISSSHTQQELKAKRLAYFSAGAQEVWFCDRRGKMSFYGKSRRLLGSSLCPGFPKAVKLAKRLGPRGKGEKPARENELNEEIKRSRRAAAPTDRAVEKPDAAKDKSPER